MTQMKLISSDKLVDDVWGKIGTPERDAMEDKLEEEVKSYYVGEAIKKARISQKLTQKQLGEKAGVNCSQVSMAERGMNITISTLSKLLRAMGMEAHLNISNMGVFSI